MLSRRPVPGASGAAMPPTAVVSVAGRRGHNEDVGGVRSAEVAGRPVSLLLVADGMGGHAHGEVASRLAADALSHRWGALVADLAHALAPEASGEAPAGDPGLPPEAEALARAFLRESYADAEAAIGAEGRGSGMGTTLVSAVVVGGHAILGNVGDSRAYLVSDGRADQLTDDHSVVADAVRQGALTPEEAEASPFQHALTRALDGQGDRGPDLYPAEGWLPLGDAAVVLLCSDGLSGSVEPPEIADALARTADVDEAARTLAARAFEEGSPDNITLALLEHGTIRREGTAPLA
ncbi:MAG: protein phosphatase 2C domain-containing protein, partial [Bacteroidota bacterium]